MCYATPGEKKELEEALAVQRAESEKELNAATNSAAARERVYAERLSGLAQVMGGKCYFPFEFIL